MKYWFLVLICVLFASCFNEGDCLISATNELHIQFKKRKNTAIDTLISFSSVVVSGTDSVLQFSTTTAEVLFPLDLRSDSTVFILNRLLADNTIATDRIVIGYSRQAKVISKDCGAYMYFQNLKVLHTNLDSLQIKKFYTSCLKDPTSSTITAYALNYQIFY